MARRAPEAGFSLIEALVALAILAVSALSLLAASEAHVGRIDGLEARALAQFVAENRLAEIELGIGEAVAPATMLRRRFEVSAAEIATADPDLVRIDLSVADGARVASFTGFVATRPAPASGAP